MPSIIGKPIKLGAAKLTIGLDLSARCHVSDHGLFVL